MEQVPTPEIPTQTVESNKIPSQRGEGLARAVRAIFRTVSRAWLACATVIGSLVLLAILGVVFAFSGFGGSAPSGNVIAGSGPEKIAVIRLNGIIDEASTPTSLLSGPTSTITPDLVQDYIDRLTAEKDVKAVIFRLNSPGGTIVASDQINEKIAKLKDSGIKVIFLYSDVAASGGYYISAPADKIVANPTTITGSIGVIAQVLNVEGLYEKLGLKDEVYKSGANKDLLNPARERTAAEVEIINRLIDQSLDQFVDKVVQGRGMEEAKVREVADGRIYSGLDAKELGLIDELGNFDKAVEVAKAEANLADKDPQIIEYTEPSFLDSLFSGKVFNLNPLGLFNNAPQTSSGIKVFYLMSL